jgi:hypothetical protein
MEGQSGPAWKCKRPTNASKSRVLRAPSRFVNIEITGAGVQDSLAGTLPRSSGKAIE